jgi:hypothetical protein
MEGEHTQSLGGEATEVCPELTNLQIVCHG